MTNQCSTDQIKKRHDELYKKALREAHDLANNTRKQDDFIKKVKGLLKDIHCGAGRVRTIEEYRWLSELVTSWQKVIVSTLNIPMSLDTLPLPPKKLLPSLPSDRALSEKELEDWRLKLAEILGLSRQSKLRRPSSDEEKTADWYNAHVFLALDVLNGFPNFASRIASASYWRLEEIWMKALKRLKAYFIWEKSGGDLNYNYAQENYYIACEHIRNMLVNKGIKARLDEFEEPKTYIENRYLSDGKIDTKKDDTQDLIRKKADRIWAVTGETDVLKNWRNAETYTRMYYESIIPAVIENDREKCLTVLKALQYSRAPENGWWVINCFEVALIIYFLNPNIIQELWDESDSKPIPESSIESIIQVQSWPKGFEVPDECKGIFEYSGGKISFNGLMTESQKKALIKNLKNSKYRAAVNDLYIQSRLIHRKTTL